MLEGTATKLRFFGADATALWLTAVCCLAIALIGPIGMDPLRSMPDLLYLNLIGLHALFAGILYRNRTIKTGSIEALAATTTVLFLFSYIFASNANMDYVQRFASGKTYLNFGPDSSTERLNSLLLYLPILAADAAIIVRRRVKEPGNRFARAALPLTIASALLYSLAFPSFAATRGIPILAWISLVPILTVLSSVRLSRFVFYGTLFGVLETMITNFWLGTFSLVTLQLVTVAYSLFFLFFMLVLAKLFRRHGTLAGLILFPFTLVAFDWIRASGFIGYPWGMIGTTQYRSLRLIQFAEVTGVWGVSAVVAFTNSAIAWIVLSGRRIVNMRTLAFPISIATILSVCVVFGAIRIKALESDSRQTSRVALIQQNSDPRKNEYRQTMETLIRLTEESLESSPDLVVWSETAFVPNIRRWSAEDPARFAYAGLVRDLLGFLKGIGTYLVTGNDDYELVINDSGEEIRNDYNAAVYFDDRGERLSTYRKIHLVPFTEYFPFRERLPLAYETLKKFDVYLWEPGVERVIFSHPDFSFATPICFEDSFPRDVRLFVAAGADVIINISNDYWSLKEAEAQQHFSNALFRAVENRRPLLRASASGVTCHISASGRIVATIPNYVEGTLDATVARDNSVRTIYNLFGDWFPLLALGLIFVALFAPISKLRAERNVDRRATDANDERGNDR